MKQGSVYEVAKMAARRFANGEIYYQDAVDSVVDAFDQTYNRTNYLAAQAAAEELIDRQLIALEEAVLDEDKMYRAAEEAARDFLSGKIDYRTAAFMMRSMLPPTYVKRNPNTALMVAQDLIDEVLNKAKISQG